MLNKTWPFKYPLYKAAINRINDNLQTADCQRFDMPSLSNVVLPPSNTKLTIFKCAMSHRPTCHFVIMNYLKQTTTQYTVAGQIPAWGKCVGGWQR